jgi:hypothetical protein
VHAGRRGEDNSRQICLGQFRFPDRRAAPCRHRLHPSQPWIRRDGFGQQFGIDIGNPVQHIGAGEQCSEGVPLPGCPLERRVAGMIAWIPLRRQEIVIREEFHSGIDVGDQVPEIGLERSGEHDGQ